MDIKYCTFESEIGRVVLYEKYGGICAVDLEGKNVPGLRDRLFRDAELQEEETELLLQAVREMKEYFAGRRRTFDLPLYMEGTDFQKRVWNALLQIPYGETRSYGEMAAMIGNRKACRAVGMANNRNPLMILVPCHRVIGADGSLVGYGGGLHIKEWLLALERKNCAQPERDREDEI